MVTCTLAPQNRLPFSWKEGFVLVGVSQSRRLTVPLASSRLQDKNAHREKLRENLGRAGERRVSGACKVWFLLATESES